ncbi:hypothetical protein B0H34DRAFT_715195 [Crassisporium funariophilum]|nr:hypothetical protein B0H34DRAFT_715195 [Crassisporium funariophilum]
MGNLRRFVCSILANYVKHSSPTCMPLYNLVCSGQVQGSGYTKWIRRQNQGGERDERCEAAEHIDSKSGLGFDFLGTSRFFLFLLTFESLGIYTSSRRIRAHSWEHITSHMRERAPNPKHNYIAQNGGTPTIFDSQSPRAHAHIIVTAFIYKYALSPTMILCALREMTSMPKICAQGQHWPN